MSEGAEAVIVGAEICAGHDGQAELLVRVRHENGVVAAVTLDGVTGFALLNVEGAGDAASLVGQPWRRILARTVLGGD
jgi:hypothetical protein